MDVWSEVASCEVLGLERLRSAAAASPRPDDIECPLCKAVKQGPCRESFYPFEACLQQCEKTGEDSMSTCNPPFMAMMGCMAQHKEVYEEIFDRLASSTSGGGGGGGGGGNEVETSPSRYVSEKRATEALAKGSSNDKVPNSAPLHSSQVDR